MKMMMMMMIKRAFILLVLSLFTAVIYSQEKDFGIWYGVTIKHEIVKKLDLEIAAVVRTFENAKKIEQEFLEGGLDYKFNDYLSAAGSYRLTNNYEDDLKYHLQHKLFLDLKGNLKIADLSLTGRFRFQARYKTYFEDVDDKIPDYTARIRLKATYKTFSFPLNPYVYAETFLPLNDDRDKVIGKNRFGAGLEFSIGKRHSIEAEYLFQRDFLPNLLDENIISFNYTLKF
ncbi:MAG: DUF2490 domain-containing protein [Bacteroidales bacterium]|nr:DUF2490 domain-containing protein [Bacteroidales bacterium]